MDRAGEYIKCYLKSLSGDKDVPLKNGEEISVGRTPMTGIENPLVSRYHLRCKANYQNKTVDVFVVGSNPSGYNGYKLNPHTEVRCTHGDIIEVLVGEHKYRIEFEDLEDVAAGPPVPANSREDVGSVLDKSHLRGSWIEVSRDECHIFRSTGARPRNKVAGFDLDGTLIFPKSKRRFPEGVDDWKLAFPQIKKKLSEAFDQGYMIVIFTNQMGISRKHVSISEFKLKIENIVLHIGVPMVVCVALSDSLYRKPRTKMWQSLNDVYGKVAGMLRNADSFYVGDAAGRPKGPNRKKDHSKADRLFAINLDLKFYTPEEYFLGISPGRFEMPEFHPKVLEAPTHITFSEPIEVILMVGAPASGKSSFCREYPEFNYISRDALGTWQKCVDKLEEYLSASGKAIIDNTNGTKAARKRFIDVAKKHKVPCRAFVLKTDVKRCLHNSKFRKLTQEKHIIVSDMVIYSYFKNYEPPTLDEGLSEIVEVVPTLRFIDEESEKLYYSYLLEN